MKLNTFIRTIQLAIFLVVVLIITGISAGVYYLGNLLYPAVDLSPYVLHFVTLHLIGSLGYSYIVYKKCKDVDSSELVTVTQRTVTVDSEEIEIVEAEINRLSGFKRAIRYFHTVTVTPNNSSVYSWNGAAQILKHVHISNSVCFVVDTPKDKITSEDFTESDTILYPNESYTPLNSSYTELQSLQFYDQNYTEISEYQVQ